MTGNSDTRKVSFEEFKLYYESTERVTDRRLATNRWNYSVCVAIFVAVAAITKWSLTVPTLLWVGFAAVVLLSAIAMLFCVLWLGQIRDFKELNNAKFWVINKMSPELEFNLEHPGQVASYCPFEKEWEKLRERNALEKVGKLQILALKSSNIETYIPMAFVGLFGMILVVIPLVSILNWPPTKLVQLPPPMACNMTIRETQQ